MRDMNRIEPFMAEVTEMWEQCPDMRFGQFMCNVLGEISSKINRDPFYIEDDDMLELLHDISWLKK